MKGYSFFKIPLYLKHMGWETFVTFDADFIYLSLNLYVLYKCHIDKDIPVVTSFIKGKMIILNEQYLSNWLNFSLSRPKVVSSNKLVTVVPSLTKEVQLAIVFGDDYVDYKFLPPYNLLSKESHILHNMLT